MSVDWGNSTAPPELQAHHCGFCGMWHQGSRCPTFTQPGEPVVVAQQQPAPDAIQACPVCQGRGEMPCGFYTGPNQTNTAPERCRACNGCGLLWRVTGQPVR